MKKINPRTNAFTLAEVLITIGIIGIVAAMTIPALLVQNRERENTAKLKKAYSSMTQAITRATTDFGTPDFWELTAKDSDVGAANMVKILSPYFNVNKMCSADLNCWPDVTTKKLNLDADDNFKTNTKYAAFTINDGSHYAFNVESPDCTAVFGETKALKNVCATFTVDVNGSKNPNQFGYDIFRFYVTKYGLQPYGLESDTSYTFKDNCSGSSNGYGCTAWVILKSNMDYLHCSDLEWNGKDRCVGFKNSKYDSSL